MKSSTRPKSKPTSLAENAVVDQALAAIREIENEAQEKRQGHLKGLEEAKAAILERIDELNHQLSQIDGAIVTIGGKQRGQTEKRARRDLTEVRERVGQWMEARKGEKFGAGDLVREHKELEDVSISFLMKPLIAAGRVKTDSSEGAKRTKYFVEG